MTTVELRPSRCRNQTPLPTVHQPLSNDCGLNMRLGSIKWLGSLPRLSASKVLAITAALGLIPSDGKRKNDWGSGCGAVG